MRNKFVIVKFGDIYIDIGCVQVVQLNVEYIYFFFFATQKRSYSRLNI